MIVSIISVGGLCNRMRVMASVADLARRQSHRVLFLWVRMPDMNASFRDLFVDFPFRVIEVGCRRSLFRMLDFLRQHWCGLVIDDDFARRYRNRQIPPNAIDKRNILTWTCENITGREDFSMFKIHPNVLSLTHLRPDGHTIGIHIRRTDNEMSRKHSPTNLFLEAMARELREDPDCCFYLATDDPAEEKTLCESFEGRVLLYPKRTLLRSEPKGIADALVDLYLLAHCRKILASYWSSFSDVAALWGKIEKTVIYTT